MCVYVNMYVCIRYVNLPNINYGLDSIPRAIKTKQDGRNREQEGGRRKGEGREEKMEGK